MAISRAMYEQKVLNELRDVPLAQFPKVLHLLHVIKEEFLTEFSQPASDTNAVAQNDVVKGRSAVEETWGNLALPDKELLKYIAEDKELEYEVD